MGKVIRVKYKTCIFYDTIHLSSIMTHLDYSVLCIVYLTHLLQKNLFLFIFFDMLYYRIKSHHTLFEYIRL